MFGGRRFPAKHNAVWLVALGDFASHEIVRGLAVTRRVLPGLGAAEWAVAPLGRRCVAADGRSRVGVEGSGNLLTGAAGRRLRARRPTLGRELSPMTHRTCVRKEKRTAVEQLRGHSISTAHDFHLFSRLALFPAEELVKRSADRVFMGREESIVKLESNRALSVIAKAFTAKFEMVPVAGTAELVGPDKLRGYRIDQGGALMREDVSFIVFGYPIAVWIIQRGSVSRRGTSVSNAVGDFSDVVPFART